MADNRDSIPVHASTIRKFASDITWSLLNSGTFLASGLVMRLLLGNYLDASSLGVYTMVNYLFSLACFIFSFSLNTTLTKFVAELKANIKERNVYISFALVLSFSLGLIALLVTFFLSSWLSRFYHMPELATLLPILSITLPTAISLSVIQSMLQGFRELKVFALISVTSNILLIAITAVFLVLGWGLFWVIMAMIISHFVILPFILFFTKRFYRISLAGFKLIAKRVLNFSSKVYGANAVALIQQQADVLIMGYFLTAADVGLYSIALMFPRFIQAILSSFAIVTFPAVSEYFGKGRTDAIQLLVNKATKYSLVIMSFFGLFAIFFAQPMLQILFPGHPEYLKTIMAIQILSGGAIILSVSGAFSGCFTAVGRPDIALKMTLISASLSLGLDFLLIRSMGMNGAAIAVATSFLLISLFSVILYKPFLSIKLDYGMVIKILAIDLISVASVMFLQKLINIYFAGVLGYLFWFSMLLLTGCLVREDRKYILAIVKR